MTQVLYLELKGGQASGGKEPWLALQNLLTGSSGWKNGEKEWLKMTVYSKINYADFYFNTCFLCAENVYNKILPL